MMETQGSRHSDFEGENSISSSCEGKRSLGRRNGGKGERDQESWNEAWRRVSQIGKRESGRQSRKARGSVLSPMDC